MTWTNGSVQIRNKCGKCLGIGIVPSVGIFGVFGTHRKCGTCNGYGEVLTWVPMVEVVEQITKERPPHD